MFWLENLEERDHSGDLCVYRRIILNLIPRKYVVRVRTESFWLRIETNGGML
jgi:hypothetical protein